MYSVRFLHCRLFIVAGVILLVSSTWLLRHLPLRHFIRVNADRNFSLSRSASLRFKDSNPTTVIHAATLHHLISSPSKEKAWTLGCMQNVIHLKTDGGSGFVLYIKCTSPSRFWIYVKGCEREPAYESSISVDDVPILISSRKYLVFV